ncbi:Flavin containing amine oxidoreductase-like protein 3 [Elsinoe fawcettii]|nr:Flavin containing amine oxidoreductase-like protein 3 [Elsinoe fawcettii]
MAKVVDAVIIGAGLSGLQAAVDLQEAGRSFIILEARDRIGGKTWSVPRKDGKGLQESGAAWINDTNQSHVWQWVQRFGLSTVVQNVTGDVACEDEEGNCHFFPFGGLPKFDQADVDNINHLRNTVEVTCLDPDTFKQPLRSEIDNLSFEQWCRNVGAGRRAIQTATLWCRGTLGHDPSEVSALAFLEIARGGLGIINLRYDGKHGAQHLRIMEGTQSIAVNMAKLLPANSIRLNSAVEAVTKTSARSYKVDTYDGQNFLARKVIVSVPGPAYKNVTFDPPLPSAKETYTTNVRHGCYLKYICLFKSPFWRRQGSCGLAQSFKGPINHCRDTSIDSQENFALTCFITSAPGRRWLSLDDAQRRNAVLDQVASLFHVSQETIQAEFLDSVTAQWMNDRWAGWGCPFAAPPPGTIGLAEDGALAREKVDGLYFVGTELTDQWRGYMEGALRSGKRGASQVLADLTNRDARL